MWGVWCDITNDWTRERLGGALKYSEMWTIVCFESVEDAAWYVHLHPEIDFDHWQPKQF